MRQLVALGTRMSCTTGVWQRHVVGHKLVGKVDLECVEALLTCQEATRRSNCESCCRMRIGRPGTVDARGVAMSRTQFGSARVQHAASTRGTGDEECRRCRREAKEKVAPVD